LASVLFLSTPAFAERLPQESFGFRLGEAIEAVQRADGGLAVKSRTMVGNIKPRFSEAPPISPELLVYQDCPWRVAAGKCQQGAERPKEGDDEPGSLRLFVARFAGSKLLGLAYNLNSRQWESTPLEKAGEMFRRRYGSPYKTSPPRTGTIQTPQVTIVHSSASWSWQDNNVRLHLLGTGNHLPGTTIPLAKPRYSYILYIESVDLRRQADAREANRPKVREQ
jgi:hypothetical protein